MTPAQKKWIDAHPDYRIVPDHISGHVTYKKRVFLSGDGTYSFKREAAQRAPFGVIELGIMQNDPPGMVKTTVPAGDAFNGFPKG